MKRLLILILAACAISIPRLPAETAEGRRAPVVVKEARAVKAAYIYNFAKFIDWTSEEGKDLSATPITIAVVGTDPVGAQLHEIAELKAKGRPIKVLHVDGGAPLPSCHMLYICASEQKRLAQILENTKNKPILTVSDLAGFTANGGMIGFISDKGRILVEINAGLAQEAGLKVSSKLLEVARRASAPSS